MRTFLLLLPIIFIACMQAGAQGQFIFMADKTKLFEVRKNEFYSADDRQLLYFQKGNIFFNGSTDERQNIFLLTTAMNLNSEKLESAFERDNREASYSFQNNKFYLGKTESDDLRENTELIHVERTGKWMSFYASYNDSLLAYYRADSVLPSAAVLVAYTLSRKYALPKKIVVQQAPLPFQNSPFSSIKPIWGNITANEWLWDGKILRPRWNADPRLAWTFDGETVKPYSSNNVYEQYGWDGETFKPVWRTNRAQEWTWDGKRLQPTYSTDWANQYNLENGIIKPWSNVHPEKEWQIEGDIPVPLIILVISGIARAN